jgi:hypothetical protein
MVAHTLMGEAMATTAGGLAGGGFGRLSGCRSYLRFRSNILQAAHQWCVFSVLSFFCRISMK